MPSLSDSAAVVVLVAAADRRFYWGFCPSVRRYAIRVDSPSGGCTERQQGPPSGSCARCRSANRDRARFPLEVLCEALPANAGYRASWCLCCTPLMGIAISCLARQSLVGRLGLRTLAFCTSSSVSSFGEGSSSLR